MTKNLNTKKRIGWRIYGSFIVVFAVLCGLSLLSYRNAETFIYETQSLDTSSAFVFELQNLTETLRGAEMANSVYVLIGKNRLLESYRENVGLLLRQLDKVHEMNPKIKQTKLEALISKRIADMDLAVSEREKSGLNSALQVFLTGRWQTLPVQIQQQMDVIRLQHNRILSTQTSQRLLSTEKTLSSVLLVGATVLVLFGMAIVTIRREMVKRLEYEDLIEKAHDDAVQGSQFKSQFLANMSHEIRTPMNGILGMISILSESKLDQAQLKSVEIMKNSSLALLRVINDILDFSKVEAGKLEICSESFELTSLLGELEALFSNMARSKGVEVQFEIDERIPTALIGDSGRIRQVFNNLIGNALKFTTKGKVTVQASVRESTAAAHKIHFEICDTGVGIPLESQAKIFGAFEQADAATGKRFGGTGLGLNISKKLVELMGGQIGFRSQPGVGSQFWFELELGAAPAATTIANIAKPEPSKPISAMRDHSKKADVLVVDDSEVNCEVLRVFLDQDTYNLDFAPNGKAAFELATSRKYDLILMDIQMPVMNGLEATSLIRSWENEQHREHTPILAFTAGVTESELEVCRNSGCDGHVEKPFNKKKVIATMQQYLAGEPDQKGRGRMENKTETLVVYVDADLEALIPKFITSQRSQLDLLKVALQERNFSDLKMLGHKIKGSCGGYGFSVLGDTGAEIEQLAGIKDVQSISQKISDLENYLFNVKIVYQDISKGA